MLKINSIKIRKDLSNEEVFKTAIQQFSILENDVASWKIIKKSIDARKKEDVHYLYSLLLEVKNEKKYLKRKNNHIEKVKDFVYPPIHVKRKFSFKPVIVGAGPARLIRGSYIDSKRNSPHYH